jgi:hypothetical protein
LTKSRQSRSPVKSKAYALSCVSTMLFSNLQNALDRLDFVGYNLTTKTILDG